MKLEIVVIFLTAAVYNLVRGKAIHNAINLRLNPTFVNEGNTATAGTALPATGVFANNPGAPFPEYRQDFLSKTYIPNIAKLGVSCTNQIARVLFPDKPSNISDTRGSNEQFIKIPIISQPFSDYKIIVATAPWNIRISGSEAKPAVIYFVFPEGDNEPTSMNIPEIYFIKKGGESININRNDKIEPLIIVDNNRTVTGLKSKEVSKFIKFKNKLHQ